MSEASFKKNLEELGAVLNQLTGDIESGPDDKVQDWYDETLKVIYNYMDEIDSNLYVRLGLDEDSIEDGEILVDNEETESIVDEQTGEVVEAEEEYDVDEADKGDSESWGDLEEDGENEETPDKKNITININFSKL